jgi:hypothetical protein
MFDKERRDPEIGDVATFSLTVGLMNSAHPIMQEPDVGDIGDIEKQKTRRGAGLLSVSLCSLAVVLRLGKLQVIEQCQGNLGGPMFEGLGGKSSRRVPFNPAMRTEPSSVLRGAPLTAGVRFWTFANR